MTHRQILSLTWTQNRSSVRSNWLFAKTYSARVVLSRPIPGCSKPETEFDSSWSQSEHDHGQSRTISNMTNSDQAADSDLDLGNQFLADELPKSLSMCVFFNLSSVFLFVLSHTIKSITSRLWSWPENLFYDEWQRRTPLITNICSILSFPLFFFLLREASKTNFW